MKKIIYLIILSCFAFLLARNPAWAQSENKLAKNMFYFEILGSGGYGSVNYERLFFRKNKFSLAARIGLSTYHLRDYTLRFNPDIIVPIACHAYYGNKHYIALGGGETISSVISADRKDFSPKRKTSLSTMIHIGYHYQKSDGGFLFKVAYTPIIEENKRYIHWGGLSIGYAF